MVAPAVLAGIQLAAGAAQSGNEGGGNVSNSPNTGFIGKTLGIQAGLEARDRKRDERRQREYEQQQRQNDAFNYGEQTRALRAVQDTAPDFAGGFSSQYITPEMLGSTTREDLGGAAFEQVLNSASGYNPVVASSPYMNAIPSQRAQQQYLKDLAGYNTERTLAGFEDRAALRGDQYGDATARLQQERDQMHDTYREKLGETRGDSRDAMAQHIIDAWIASEDSSGANRKYQQTGGILRRDKGAYNSEKELDVTQMLESGMSYVDILNDPRMRNLIRDDATAGPLFGQWEG